MHIKNLLWNKKIYVLTDSKYLTYNINLKKQPNIVSRWILNIQNFHLEFQHIKENNYQTDNLSRHVMAISSMDSEKNYFSLIKDFPTQI